MTEPRSSRADAARVLASVRPIDRDYLHGRATLEQLAASLPDGVPPCLASAYANELRELLALEMTVEEAEHAAQDVACAGTAEDVVRWLKSAAT
jgi:hypothetical protein